MGADWPSEGRQGSSLLTGFKISDQVPGFITGSVPCGELFLQLLRDFALREDNVNVGAFRQRCMFVRNNHTAPHHASYDRALCTHRIRLRFTIITYTFRSRAAEWNSSL